jgi:hypothetical protein
LVEDQRVVGKSSRAKRLPSTAGPVKHGPRQYGPPPTSTAIAQMVCEKSKPKPQKKPKRKADPKLVAAARELRDRWLERVNTPAVGTPAVGTGVIASAGKYDVTREIAATAISERRLLLAA